MTHSYVPVITQYASVRYFPITNPKLSRSFLLFDSLPGSHSRSALSALEVHSVSQQAACLQTSDHLVPARMKGICASPSLVSAFHNYICSEGSTEEKRNPEVLFPRHVFPPVHFLMGLVTAWDFVSGPHLYSVYHHKYPGQ